MFLDQKRDTDCALEPDNAQPFADLMPNRAAHWERPKRFQKNSDSLDVGPRKHLRATELKHVSIYVTEIIFCRRHEAHGIPLHRTPPSSFRISFSRRANTSSSD